MKLSESWLREWVNPKITRDNLCEKLTMAGLEVEELAPVSNDISAGKDFTIDISITPNRGDCLSIRGVAREVAALTKTSLKEVNISAIKPTIKDTLPIKIQTQAKSACPRYVGRIIRGVKADAVTPAWLKERLLTSGLKSISAIVDVTNYVMLELGQPMHAFDLNTLDAEINVRLSRKGEHIHLLDGTEKKLDGETLVIADKLKPVAIAGVMGGLDSCVTLLTRDILLEAAYFSSETIAKQRPLYGLNSDSSYRFERGVDPTIQREAIERATKLILEIVGGEAGPIMEVASKSALPKEKIITLTTEKLSLVLGLTIPLSEVDAIFKALQFPFKRNKNKWQVRIPAYRFDLALPEDLVEEVARLYGYENIPPTRLKADLIAEAIESTAKDFHDLRKEFCNQGFNEVISYSFVDRDLQKILNPEQNPRELMNPITSDMAVMRTNLWPGLINTLLYNKSRQQQRVRVFEIGTCFTTQNKKLIQAPKMAGLMTGLAFPEQWGMSSREADFYDLKGVLENVLARSFSKTACTFKPDSHPALHPGRTAGIYQKDKKIGILGALHPALLQNLAISNDVFVFELDLQFFSGMDQPRVKEISKFPEIRRDIAILVKQTIPAKDIQDTIKSIAGAWLKDVFIFDVYQGKGITPGFKSLALALILQDPTRTLVDDEVANLMDKVITALKGQLGAELRS